MISNVPRVSEGSGLYRVGGWGMASRNGKRFILTTLTEKLVTVNNPVFIEKVNKRRPISLSTSFSGYDSMKFNFVRVRLHLKKRVKG